MCRAGLRGVVRDKTVRTTISQPNAPWPRITSSAGFRGRPNHLWVSDFMYVSTYQGFAYVAFVINVYLSSMIDCYDGLVVS